ncbi:MAG: ankyrin repeat domain-containing protein [Candidatus Solibacter sp.]
MRNQLRMGALALVGGLLAVSGFSQSPETTEQYYESIRKNDMPMLHALVNTKGVKVKDKYNTTPLHYAAANGSVEALKTILSAGAEVNAANDFGATPLMWGITEPEKVRLLVGAGADVNAKSKMGRTALYLACANDGSSSTVRFLVEHGAKVDGLALVAAAQSNDLASLRILLEKNVPVNEKDEAGRTPLMWAAGNGNLKAVEMLLAKGADVNAVSLEKFEMAKNGPLAIGNLTALMLASVGGGPDVVKMLLDAGAKINAVDVRQMTPLMTSVATDHPDARTVHLLIQRGSDLSMKDNTGATATDWAKKYNSPAILREFGLTRQKAENARVIVPTSILGKLDPEPAAARAIATLQKGSATFFKEGGCGACHAANLTSMAVNAAYANHVPVNLEAKAGEIKGAQLFLAGLQQPLLQRGDPPVVDILLYGGMQMVSENVVPDASTDALVHNVVAQQRAAGNWHFGIMGRPPMEDGDFSRTAMGIRLLQVYGQPGRKAELQKRIERAARWLAANPPKTTEDLNMQLLGLKWAGASRRITEAGIRRLMVLQREDGGWGQTPDIATDSYATGQVLYTLHELGLPVTDPIYRRGVQYLLQTQAADGTWHVKSRAAKFQPYFESGLPYGHDQWISAAATSWAAMALSYATGPQQVARRLAQSVK